MPYDELYHRYNCEMRDDKTGAKDCPFDLYVPAWIGSIRCPYHGHLLSPTPTPDGHRSTWERQDVPSGAMVMKVSVVGW